MPASLRDRFTPTAVGLVSRAWVIEAVEERVSDPRRRAALIDELVAFEPPRRHGLRNMFLFWTAAIGASALAGMMELPRWWGFVAVLVVFTWLARLLATRGLLWQLDRLAAKEAVADDRGPSA
jgi:hypothetical protein